MGFLPLYSDANAGRLNNDLGASRSSASLPVRVATVYLWALHGVEGGTGTTGVKSHTLSSLSYALVRGLGIALVIAITEAFISTGLRVGSGSRDRD
jgi:hypothetical protein